MVLVTLEQNELTQSGTKVRIHLDWSRSNPQCPIRQPIDRTAVPGVRTFDHEILDYEIAIAFQHCSWGKVLRLDHLIMVDPKYLCFVSFCRSRSFFVASGLLRGRRLEQSAGFDLGSPSGFLELLYLLITCLES